MSYADVLASEGYANRPDALRSAWPMQRPNQLSTMPPTLRGETSLALSSRTRAAAERAANLYVRNNASGLNLNKLPQLQRVCRPTAAENASSPLLMLLAAWAPKLNRCHDGDGLAARGREARGKQKKNEASIRHRR